MALRLKEKNVMMETLLVEMDAALLVKLKKEVIVLHLVRKSNMSK